MADVEIATVPVSLNYYQPPADGSKPWVRAGSDLDPKAPPTNFSYEEKQVIIENIRGHESEYDLDSSGFLFYKHESEFKNFEDETAIQDVYYKESIKLIKKVTGANRVVLFDHTVRKHRPGLVNGTDGVLRGPATRVHVDQTPKGAINRVHRHTSEELAPLLLKHRFQIVNLWRPINHPAFDYPLALCDYRSVDWEKDLVPAEFRYPDRVGEAFYVNYNSQHKWKYQRGMRPDEVIFVKCFDSRDDGKTAILTPHTAFADPTSPKDALPRESIELRALVFYDDLPNDA
ncbi:hypothetical protein Clacol_005890 [Clathrus columnatus]|uniref:Methyltransferase n=1 Tax=Clathrus columnatus TaxID=1419009 RepID=A0AAV5AAL9_9AGAM|nr:hypothetical protein Clacol_005890 [Clathrus columnatus]